MCVNASGTVVQVGKFRALAGDGCDLYATMLPVLPYLLSLQIEPF